MSDTPFSLKRIALPAFGPSVFYGVATGAVLPIIALTARDLGASVALSGLIAALVGLGSLAGNIPAALLTTRFGEKRALQGASVLCALALLVCILASHVAVLTLGVVAFGVGGSIFTLARQAYLIEAVPLNMRARALSTLAGSMRIGVFFGPFAGAGLIYLMGLNGAYWIAIAAMAGSFWLTVTLPELERTAPGATPSAAAATAARSEARKPTHPSQPDSAHARASKPSLLMIGRTHLRVYATIGVGAMLISALRASRQVVIPLWADHIGLDPAAASLIYGISAAIDMAVFYPAGKVMDRHGRIWVAVPSTILMGSAMLAMPFALAAPGLILAALVIGLGNGISTGIIMTTAADASPTVGRNEFLGLWRMLADIGSSGGPLLLSLLTATASLGVAIAAVGALGWLAAAVFWKWLPRPAR